MIKISTKLTPEQLLEKLLSIEESLGRIRGEKWGSRIIDIDILVYGDVVVKLPQLSIPHPFLAERNFVILPLIELNQDLDIPNLGKIKNLMSKKDLNQGIKKL